MKWSVTLTDRLGPEMLTVLEIKGQVLHRVRLHVKVPSLLLNLNALLARSFNIVDQAHAQLRRRNHGHHGCKDGNKARQFCVWLIVRANLSFGEITLFPPKTCLRVISYSM